MFSLFNKTQDILLDAVPDYGENDAGCPGCTKLRDLRFKGILCRRKNTIFGYDYEKDVTIFCSKFVVTRFPKATGAVSILQQTVLFDVATDKYEPDLARTVFFDELLAETGVAATCSEDRPFWLARVLDAFDKKLHIYYIDIGGSPLCVKLKDKEHFYKVDSAHKILIDEEQAATNTKKILISKILLLVRQTTLDH